MGSRTWHPLAWRCCGALLLIWAVVLTWLSRQFVYGSDMTGRPIPALVALMMAGAMVYFLAVYLAMRTTPARRLAYCIFAVGALMRLAVAPSLPILEDDYYRYLWDGAVTATGNNPYAVIPADVQARSETIPSAYRELGQEAGHVIDRVNHPELGTIYPPVAQAAFAVAHWIAPWRLSGLRVLYYALDCAVFALLLALLKTLGRPPLLVLVYWWNPLAIKEVYNSVHMDLLLVPLILATLLLVLRGRIRWSMVPLALAVGTKLWPVLFLPPILARGIRTPRNMVISFLIFVPLALLLLLPLGTAVSFGEDSGFIAYGARWEMNDALFMIFPWMADQISTWLDLGWRASTTHRVGKLAVMALVGLGVAGITWWTFRTSRRDNRAVAVDRQWCIGLTWLVAALFLLSPTQFPWYYLWLLPLLVASPNRALLGYTLMLPLYYLRFYFDARGEATFFHHTVVWIEHGPILALLAVDAWRLRRFARSGPSGRPGERTSTA